MELSLTLVDRIYESIVQWCDTKNITINEYCVKLIEDGFYTEKYGDLNQMMAKKEDNTENKIVTKKKSSEKKSETVKNIAETVKDDIKSEVNNGKDIDTVRKIKRTLKAK